MRALVKTHAGPGLLATDVPTPGAGASDVTIRVWRTGICGTDLHIDSWDSWAESTIRPPLVPGHEFSGTVVGVGSAVRDVEVGATVSGEGHIVCGMCRNCRAGRRHLCARTSGVGIHRDGAFAEYVVLPESNVWVHPGPIDPDIAAIFDPFGNAVHTALKFPVVGEDVLITGAGPIGLMAAAVVRHVGARFVVVTDVSEPRLKLARRVGADMAVNVATDTVADAQRALGMKEGFDVGLEMSGHSSALPQMIDNLSHGASVALLGLPTGRIDVDWSKVVTHMITISGIYGREMFETWNAMSAMLQTSAELRAALDRVITHRLPARDWREGFAIARDASAGKVVLDWTQHP